MHGRMNACTICVQLFMRIGIPRVFVVCVSVSLSLCVYLASNRIIVSHDILSVCRMVDHIYVLDQGTLVHQVHVCCRCVLAHQPLSQGSHAELMSNRAEQYVRLLGADDAVPDLSGSGAH